MIRSGIVTQIFTIGGVIQDANKREFYFGIDECSGVLPELHSTVTFIRDTDFKLTDVALSVKPSKVFNSKAG